LFNNFISSELYLLCSLLIFEPFSQYGMKILPQIQLSTTPLLSVKIENCMIKQFNLQIESHCWSWHVVVSLFTEFKFHWNSQQWNGNAQCLIHLYIKCNLCILKWIHFYLILQTLTNLIIRMHEQEGKLLGIRRLQKKVLSCLINLILFYLYFNSFNSFCITNIY